MTTIHVEMTEELTNREAKIRYLPVVVDGTQVYHDTTAFRFTNGARPLRRFIQHPGGSADRGRAGGADDPLLAEVPAAADLARRDPVCWIGDPHFRIGRGCEAARFMINSIEIVR